MSPLLHSTNNLSLVLASGSATRRELLAGAGLSFEVMPPAVDEEEIKASLRAEQATAAQAAETLAELKALAVSRKRSGALVIGADQLLECDGEWFDKPVNRAEARAQLRRLSGRSHRLFTSVCLLQNGQRLWHHNAVVELAMRPLSEAFLDSYLDAAGDRILSSVGGYQLEGLGAQLFYRVNGDFFTVLGLPLLPLLEILRAQGVLPS
ncbi:MAG TPA: nucleoside triphosphate pyrophosphatase [Kiloniellales bacterium]|jgi:septum formation protein|nr:nucleoside triphosphate pyrophosphatase [Kiloniellales bacterium]